MDEKEGPARTQRSTEEPISVVWATAIRVAALVVGVAVVLAALLIPP